MRAQAGVLKRAVIEEQNKNATLREAVRVKETNLRRVEQEVDSLGFRNKQLEHRVASLQDDLSNDNNSKKSAKNSKTKAKPVATVNASQSNEFESSSVFSEEFQKKIFECAQLSSTIADKTTEIQLQTTRIDELESMIRSMNAEQSDSEAKLRREVERLTVKNHEIEAKLAEASSIVGSDDTLYVSECDQQQKSLTNNSSNGSNSSKMEERLAALEKELVYWRAQCEVLQITAMNHQKCDLEVEKIENENSITTEKVEKSDGFTQREQMLVDHFAKKIEDLLLKKCVAESKLAIYVEEVFVFL